MNFIIFLNPIYSDVSFNISDVIYEVKKTPFAETTSVRPSVRPSVCLYEWFYRFYDFHEIPYSTNFVKIGPTDSHLILNLMHHASYI